MKTNTYALSDYKIREIGRIKTSGFEVFFMSYPS
jgi:hypothetical protein